MNIEIVAIKSKRKMSSNEEKRSIGDEFAKKLAENRAKYAKVNIQSGLDQLRDPKRDLKQPISSAESKFQVYHQVIRNDGVSTSIFNGETDWETIYKDVYNDLTNDDLDNDVDSDVSDNEYQKMDTCTQDDEDNYTAVDDDISIYSTYSRVSQTSRMSCQSSFSAAESCTSDATCSTSNKKKKSTDEEIKIAAYAMTFCEISKPCKCPQNCSDNLTIAQVRFQVANHYSCQLFCVLSTNFKFTAGGSIKARDVGTIWSTSTYHKGTRRIYKDSYGGFV